MAIGEGVDPIVEQESLVVERAESTFLGLFRFEVSLNEGVWIVIIMMNTNEGEKGSVQTEVYSGFRTLVVSELVFSTQRVTDQIHTSIP